MSGAWHWPSGHGVTTGQPAPVQTTRPWIAGLIGVVAAMWSASTWSMMFCVVTRLVKFG
jgi:hypothetical protein